MEARRELSRRLYDVLENVGASEELRQLHQDTATKQEILQTVMNTFMCGILINNYYCGSSYEGSVTPDLAADTDIIHCNSYPPVVADVPAAPPLASLLMVRDDTTYPGYVKLQFVLNGQPLTANNMILLPNCTFDTTGRVCMKHIKFPNMHGPASMHVDDNGFHLLDQVPAFQCKVIPPFVLDCLSRPRPYGRSQELQAMAGLGCLFVGVGHVNSDEKDIEWRISFSLQEKRLMASLNPVQHKVYVLLKVIKKNILAGVLRQESLTSYHCKTCILYLVQMTPKNSWTKDNLVNCLLMGMNLLTKWIEQNNCPSYFVKDQNLFLKEDFFRMRLSLLWWMRRLLERGSDILYFLQSDNVGQILRNRDLGRYRDVTMEKKNTHGSKLKILCAYLPHFSSIQSLLALGRGRYDPVSLASALGALQRLETVNHHTAEVTQSALAYLYPQYHLHIAKGLVSLTFRHPDTVDRQQLIEMADFHFNEARGVDLVNERLARASVLYRSEQYGECFLLLQQVDNDLTRNVVFICPCLGFDRLSPPYGIHDPYRQERRVAALSIENIIRTQTATCVIFLPSELELAPAPLQYEMQRSLGTLPGSRLDMLHYWYDWAVVDAIVYLYFLQYLVSSKLHKDAHKQVAMDNIRAEIALSDRQMLVHGQTGLGHKDTAYNLLGWIYMQEGRLVEAARCSGFPLAIAIGANGAKYKIMAQDFFIWRK